MLGMTLDLAGLRQAGSVTLKTKEGRVEKISSKVLQVQQSGNMILTEAQEIHGLLNFATGYFAGRSLRYSCFKIFSLVDKCKSQARQLKAWCEEVLVLLESVQRRTIPININTNTVLVFRDGSWEGGVGGLGAVLLDESTGSRIVIQDEVHESPLSLWKGAVGDQIICQIEYLQWFSYGGNGNTNFIIVVSFFLLTTTQPGGDSKGQIQ